MDASGFTTLASYFPDRTVVTYDPRGLGRSTRNDGRVDHTPTDQAEDVHALIQALAAGPVELFASSGGAVTALALVTAYPDDVTTLVAHEPPLITVLPDSQAAERALTGSETRTRRGGRNAGMAAFLAMTSWRGEFTQTYFDQPAPDPAAFGMPTDDDGSRDDPLLSDRSGAVSAYRPHTAGHRPASRAGADRVPEPPRRVRRRRFGICREARRVRTQTTRGPRRGRRRRRPLTRHTTQDPNRCYFPRSPIGLPLGSSSTHTRASGAT